MPEELEAAFNPARAGRFMERFGPLGRDKPYSQQKLCLVATDRAYLVNLLYELSQREDCYYVKYSTTPRDGMYLGRCFLATDGAAGQLCQELKAHPKLLVSLQDDAFFNAYRQA